jgi:pyruvate/2-oxoglutarate dehydrogenase complex dihydrolipoamide acyltransferase (E2) component
MAIEILLPKLSFSMAEGTLAEWLMTDGASVKEGEPLYMLETDKAVQEVEAPASGTLKIERQAGHVYPVGEVLGRVLLD